MIRYLILLVLSLPAAFDARADQLIDRLVALQTMADGKPSDYFSSIKISQETCARRDSDEFTRFECPVAKGGEATLEVNIEWRNTSKLDWRRMTFWLVPESEGRSIRDLRKLYFSDWSHSLDSHQNVFDDSQCGYRLRKVKGNVIYAVGVWTRDAAGNCGARVREFVFSIVRE